MKQTKEMASLFERVMALRGILDTLEVMINEALLGETSNHRIDTTNKRFEISDFIPCESELPYFDTLVLVAIGNDNLTYDIGVGRRLRKVSPSGQETWEVLWKAGAGHQIVGWKHMPDLPRFK